MRNNFFFLEGVTICLIECIYNRLQEDIEIATIYSIAKKIGISASTVSRALRNSGYVRKELKEQIFAVAKEMEYEPNLVAVGLLSKQSYSLGLVLPDITNPYFPEIARGVEDAASKNGYNVFLCNTDGITSKEASYLKLLRSKQIDGVIFIAANEDPVGPRRLQKANIPIVLVDRRVDIQCDYVTADNFRGGFIATRHLLERGHRRIAVVTGPAKLSSSIQRLEGYKAALQDEGVKFSESLVIEGDYQAKGGYASASAFLSMNPRPTAVFVCNDLMAIGLMEAFEQYGVSVPKDCSIVGYDDTMLASVCRPKLTTVSQPKYEMGSLACEIMIDRLKRPDAKLMSEVFMPKLVIRESTIRV